MSKRKVHFASTTDEAIEDAIAEQESGKRQKKTIKLGDDPIKKNNHTLDSDEEVDEDKYNVLEDDDIDGQEDCIKHSESEGRFTGFNMKDELTEGHFDKQGTFIFDKDNNQITDNWMDNVDWVQIKKKQGIEKEAYGSDSDDDDSDDDDLPKLPMVDGEKKKLQTYREMLVYMKPTETILKALRRLGGGNRNPSRKWEKPKAQKVDQKKGLNPQLESLEKLTGLANNLLQDGDYEIYQATFEKLTHILKVDEEKKLQIPKGIDEDDALDMFADDIDNSDAKQSTSKIDKEDAKSTVAATQVTWQYKWKQGDDTEEIHGPYTSEEMLEWTEGGFFKEKPIVVRKTSSKDSTFYDAARIDFDLYI